MLMVTEIRPEVTTRPSSCDGLVAVTREEETSPSVLFPMAYTPPSTWLWYPGQVNLNCNTDGCCQRLSLLSESEGRQAPPDTSRVQRNIIGHK